MIETSDVDELDVPIEVLETTSEAFLTSSTRDVMPIVKIDERALEPGPLTAGAAAALAELMATDLDP